MSFDTLGLSPGLLRAVSEQGYERPTPIQIEAIPVVREGRDLLAGAQTGTGKTAAFALPILDRLLGDRKRPTVSRRPIVLVLAPTRELAAQVNEAFRVYGKHLGVRSTAIYGGVGMRPQVDAVRNGVHIVVATPGRLLDHMEQGTIDLRGIEILTLDEADRMLDMGFMPALQRILSALPRDRQTLLFSATLSSEIQSLSARFMREPAEVHVSASNSVAATVAHRVHPVAQERKRELLAHLLSRDSRAALVFCRTKHGSDRLCKQLVADGVRATAIHGNKSQNARMAALAGFKAGRSRVLVATDIAARGLDIEQLPMVINYDLPMVAHDYIHRIGRTGRAGMDGQAISLVSRGERGLLRDIERLLKHSIEVEAIEGFDVEHRDSAGVAEMAGAPRGGHRGFAPRNGSTPRRSFGGPRNSFGKRGGAPRRRSW